MRLRQGVQAEVLLSLALVMLTATGLLAAIFLEIHHARLESLHGLLGRGFVASARGPAPHLGGAEYGSWWRIDESGRVSGLNVPSGWIDDATRTLADEAGTRSEPMVQSGAPWSAIRFAMPRTPDGGMLVGRIDAPVSGLVLVALLFADVSIFGLFGVTLLRRRVVGPLHRLARRVREMGEAELPASVPVEGVDEIAELARAFNDMQVALAARTGALEKAVVELRDANRHLVQAREGLDQAERLAMVGSLAAGVAHEVGNPMGALLSFLDVAARDPGLGDEARRCLARASEQGERVRVILRQLLDFSRPPRVEHGPVDLLAVARQVVELVSAQQRFGDIALEIEAEPGLALAVGDSSLASQILLNLALNAAVAVAGCDTRRIRIRLSNEVWRRRVGDDETGAPDGRSGRADALVCRVEDSGPGVEPAARDRIFDPFFTTKAPGEGTGLGLANARRLAQQMGGEVDLQAERCELGGACFRFRLRRLGVEGADRDSGRCRADASGPAEAQSRIP